MNYVIKLKDMTCTRRTLKFPYGSIKADDYVLETDSGHKLTITRTFGSNPYILTLTAPNGSAGSIANGATAQEVLDKFVTRLFTPGAVRRQLAPKKFIQSLIRMSRQKSRS